jgi:hypothetical protein
MTTTPITDTHREVTKIKNELLRSNFQSTLWMGISVFLTGILLGLICNPVTYYQVRNVLLALTYSDTENLDPTQHYVNTKNLPPESRQNTTSPNTATPVVRYTPTQQNYGKP